MKIITNILDLNKAIYNFKNIGFVPTMGGIHKGHLSLIKNSQKKCKKTLVSIFVNPSQFNDKSDYKNYPRNLNKDIKILKKYKVDYLLIPEVKEIYKRKMKKLEMFVVDPGLHVNFIPGGKHVMFSGLKEFKESLLMCAFSSNTGVEFPFSFEVLTNER